MPIEPLPSRRRFLASATRSLIALIAPIAFIAEGRGGGGQGPHPEPRPGVDGSKVLTAGQLTDSPELVSLFDGIREIPHIADGIRCQCGCAVLPGRRSLLTCYEDGGMAVECHICQTEGRVVIRLHRQGRTLQQIREAIDARF